jgi:hypothetical protein
MTVLTILSGCKKESPTATETPDTTPPSVVITYPANGATLTEAVTIKVDAADNRGVQSVTFLVDGSVIGKDSVAPYEQFWNVGYWADGNQHTVLAKAVDPSGNVGQSQVVTVTLSTTAQIIPEVVSPADSSFADTNGVRLVWKALPNAAQYQVQISSSSNFTPLVVDTTLTDTLAAVPLSRLAPWWNYWRIRARFTTSAWSGWSQPRRCYKWLTFGGSSYDYGFSVQQTTDGGFIIVGVTSSFGVGSADVYLIKTDASGNQLWQKTFGGSNSDWGHSVQQTSDGGFIIAGHTSSFGAGFSDVYLIKTDASGDQQWQKTFGGDGYEAGNYVQQTSDGGYIIAGSINEFSSSDSSVYLIKADGYGSKMLEKVLLGKGARSIQQTLDGGYIISEGLATSAIGGRDSIHIIKTDGNGAMEWWKTFRGSGIDFGSGASVKQTIDGGYIIGGIAAGFGATVTGSFFDIYLIKTDISGNISYQRSYGGNLAEHCNSLQQTTDGGYVIAGDTYSFGAGSSDVYLVKTDGNGNQLWQKTFGGSNPDYGYSVQQTSDGGYIIAGFTHSFGAGSGDVFLIKTDANGNLSR